LPSFTQQDLPEESKFDLIGKNFFSKHVNRLNQDNYNADPRDIQWIQFSRVPGYIKDPFYNTGQKFIE